jgi:deoxyadenosine/deoxycytidine kinase
MSSTNKRKGARKMKIAVGGMIAAGKTNLSKRLSEELEIPVMTEYDENNTVYNTLLQWLYEGVPNIEMLLQIFFLQEAWSRQKEYGHNFIVDRDLIEHWLFAQENLKNKPEIMSMYNGLFHAYMTSITKPDLYIILDVDWKRFKERVFNRQRSQEVDNFESNATYFSNLLQNYVQRLRAQCVIFDIPYVVIDTNDKTEDEVFDAVFKKINAVITKRKKQEK